MIILYHRNKKVVFTSPLMPELTGQSLTYAVHSVAKDHPEKLIIWCHEALRQNLNMDALPSIFHHRRLLITFAVEDWLDARIGYVEVASIYKKIDKTVKYATWRMSADVGGIYGEAWNACRNGVNLRDDFDYLLHSLARRALPNGLLCYSQPDLLTDAVHFETAKSGISTLFRFVKQHYRFRWTILLLLNFGIYEKRLPILPFLKALFFRRRNFENDNLAAVKVASGKPFPYDKTVDVIIPTIGRSQYLYNVLKDLASQTHLPARVIITEQNPDPEGKSELSYLTGEQWPFEITHIFTHQAGVCNARNLCLDEVNSEFVFFTDDDHKLQSDLIEKALACAEQFGNDVFQIATPGEDEAIPAKIIRNWHVLGAGNVMIRRAAIGESRFRMGYEFGHGEDNDFGMQLRKKGFDILYLPDVTAVHLRAPYGGYRIIPSFPWSGDAIQPKPSPTIMLFQRLYYSVEQIRGYKTMLFINTYGRPLLQGNLKAYRQFKARWDKSVYWAKELESR